MRALICLPVICVLLIFQIGCCSSWGKGTWNDNISGLWSRRSDATTAPESATFANQGLYLGQQSRYISPPSSTSVVAVPSTVTAPLPNATPTHNPVIPAAPTPTPVTTPATAIPFPTSTIPYSNPFNATADLPSTVPASPTLTELPSNYVAATTPTPQNQSFDFTAPQPSTAIAVSPFANNATSGSISSKESLFAPTQNSNINTNTNTNTNTNNIAPLNNTPNPNNPNQNNINIPLTAYEIAAAGTAETAYQSLETKSGTQIKTSQNGVITITAANLSPVTSSSHFVTEIKPAD
jgi:hypothetical protein